MQEMYLQLKLLHVTTVIEIIGAGVSLFKMLLLINGC